MALRVLVCDDEELIRWSLAEHLGSQGYLVDEAEDGEACVAAAMRSAPDAILLDLNMPKLDGLGALAQLRENGIEAPVLVITAHGAIESAIEATRLGATSYVSKPFDLREITLQLERAITRHRLAEEVHHLRNRQQQAYGKLVGQSPAMKRVFDLLTRLEDVEAPTVMIQGESGTGKDLVAQAIHTKGPRRERPFMEIDCASLPDQLIQSELFGHEKGSFTDARQMKRGLFEVARGGTIFLDEIGELSLGTQAKLLRALENRRFKRVGGLQDISLDASVIAATNRDLQEEVRTNRFREDLYFRLNVIVLQVPPLRDRVSDVPLLTEHFLDGFNQRMGRAIEGVSKEALLALQAYEWPGNVRELRNVVERIVILEREADVIRLEHLPHELRNRASGRGGVASHAQFALPEDGIDLEDVERSFLIQALERSGGNQSAAARLLAISRYALRYRMEKFGLMPRKPQAAES